MSLLVCWAMIRCTNAIIDAMFFLAFRRGDLPDPAGSASFGYNVSWTDVREDFREVVGSCPDCGYKVGFCQCAESAQEDKP